MANTDHIHEVKIEVIVPPHEQTCLADAGVYTTFLEKKFAKEITNYISENIEKLPITKIDDFDYNTHNNIHIAEFCIVSKELAEKYVKMESEDNIKI
ncbi:hypothetical protein [Bacillus testis]|uniref:hypothetical protein n=1 Tax=Bacillus testis TaxID=1622072 RepID=UPI00067EC1A8|nr:hypothetical protein [Bacillus testis]